MFVEVGDFQNRHHVSADVFEFKGTVALRYVFLGVEDGPNPGRIQISVSRKIEDDIGKTFSVFFDNEFFESERVFKADAPLNPYGASCALCEDLCVEVFHVCFARNLL